MSALSSSSDTSIAPFDPSKVPLTQPLRLARPNQPITIGDISRPILQSTTNLAAQQNLVQPQPTKSILKHRPQPSTSLSTQTLHSGEKSRTHLKNVPSSISAPSANLGNISAPRRPDLSNTTVRPNPGNPEKTNMSQYRPTSGRPPIQNYLSDSGSSSSVTAYSSQGESNASTATGPGVSYGLDFPLPPSTFQSIPGSGSSFLPSSSSVKQSSSRKRTSVSSVGTRKSMNGGSTSGALANVGDLMMKGFGDSDMSGDETSDVEANFVTATVKRVGNPAIRSSDVLNVRKVVETPALRFPPLPPQPAISSVPSILVTATSGDSLRSLNKRLSRAAKQQQHSAVTQDSILIPQSKSLSRFDSDDDDKDQGFRESRIAPTRPSSSWAPLSQMAFEQSQPNYRSATYSIYNMYRDEEGPHTAETYPLPPNTGNDRERDISDTYHRTPKVTTMSRIYSGYGLGNATVGGLSGNGNVDEEDIGASFAKEMGATLGRMGYA